MIFDLGAKAIFESFYGKPKKAIHYGSVNCDGNEQELTNCVYVHYSLEHGKELNIHVEVGGVNCHSNLTHDIISIIDSLTTSISTHLTTTGKLQHVSSKTTTAINAISITGTGSTNSTRATGVSDTSTSTTSTTSTSNEVVIRSFGVTALVFGITALIVGYVSAFYHQN